MFGKNVEESILKLSKNRKARRKIHSQLKLIPQGLTTHYSLHCRDSGNTF
jgi:hypothetical protein